MRRWQDISIRTKSVLLMGVMLVSMWTLVVLAMQQLRAFSGQSDVIMNEYMDITGFLDTFSAENVALEMYIRPTPSADALENYLAASQDTDRQLRELRPNWNQDLREEYLLKQAICNAMEHYRKSQAVLLSIEERENLIPQYLSLKTQSAYIDGLYPGPAAQAAWSRAVSSGSGLPPPMPAATGSFLAFWPRPRC